MRHDTGRRSPRLIQDVFGLFLRVFDVSFLQQPRYEDVGQVTQISLAKPTFAGESRLRHCHGIISGTSHPGRSCEPMEDHTSPTLVCDRSDTPQLLIMRSRELCPASSLCGAGCRMPRSHRRVSPGRDRLRKRLCSAALPDGDGSGFINWLGRWLIPDTQYCKNDHVYDQHRNSGY